MTFLTEWRRLAAAGAFTPFRRARDLTAGAARLEALGAMEDELGLFISVIAGLGLAVPILEAAEARDPALGSLIDATLRGDAVFAVAITETQAGSDALAMQSELTFDASGRLRLTGAKWHITNAPVASHAVVFAWCRRGAERFLAAVLVPLDAPGVTRGPALDLIGARASPTGGLTFRDVALDPSAFLGDPTDGRLLLDRAFAAERLLAPWPLIGKMGRVLQEALDHVDARVQFGKKIREFQYVQGKVVSAWTRYEEARLVAGEALARHAAGARFEAHASLAKVLSADAAVDVFRLAIELRGAAGVQVGARLGQWLSDALCAAIAGGTREMHQRAIFDHLLLDRTRARRGRVSAFFPSGGRPRADGGEDGGQEP